MQRPPHNDESDSSAHRSGHYPHVSHSGPPSSPSPSPSPSPAPSAHVKAPSIVTSHPHPLPPIPPSTPTVPSQTLAPPPHAPHGPRYPSQNNLSNNSRSRSPSPDKDNVTPPMSAAHHGGEWERERSAPGGRHRGHGSVTSLGASDGRGVDPSTAPRMSEKALGKRRQIEPEDSESE